LGLRDLRGKGEQVWRQITTASGEQGGLIKITKKRGTYSENIGIRDRKQHNGGGNNADPTGAE